MLGRCGVLTLARDRTAYDDARICFLKRCATYALFTNTHTLQICLVCVGAKWHVCVFAAPYSSSSRFVVALGDCQAISVFILRATVAPRVRYSVLLRVLVRLLLVVRSSFHTRIARIDRSTWRRDFVSEIINSSQLIWEWFLLIGQLKYIRQRRFTKYSVSHLDN